MSTFILKKNTVSGSAFFARTTMKQELILEIPLLQ